MKKVFFTIVSAFVIVSCNSSNDVAPIYPGDDKDGGIEATPPTDGEDGTDKDGDTDIDAGIPPIIDGDKPEDGTPTTPPLTDIDPEYNNPGNGDTPIDGAPVIGYIEKRGGRNIVFKTNQTSAVGEAVYNESDIHTITFTQYSGIGGSGGETTIYTVVSITGSTLKLSSENDILYLDTTSGYITK
ncbi:hypothetical protein [Flammeovirga kamogawensis]|uniref:Uncharacterized protein n=1 Tax=Flammeovirga kamogawensis TaxID=373891 RepID=A0ABX8H4H4_9BACT|nr:hypothetical protein [Flammeovirga kamogawensis]MBB6463553.1 hypothetical protein [Flammeovirga kamogawensis]QWG10608.1 hypothetical protein KM029_24815 [Flammeovirga kamogawensis]TRX63713.1 hypothetical protein EO216_25195 [Flammeovirga kamogawensis]